MRQSVLDFASRALADVSAHVDDEDLVGHVYFALVHIVQHLLGAFGPDFIVSAVAEQADADDDVTGEGQALLRLQELLLKARAAAEGYDGVLADHGNYRMLLFFKRIRLIIDIAEKAIIEKPVRCRLDMLHLVAFKFSR